MIKMVKMKMIMMMLMMMMMIIAVTVNFQVRTSRVCMEVHLDDI